MKKVIVAALAAMALAVVPASAGAISAGTAQSWGNSYARDDCGRAWDWYCAYFPYASNVWSCADNRWCVSVAYGEKNVFTSSNRGCWTDTHFAINTGTLTYKTKYC